jgi:succinate dehydrogenase / fumarate reductase membrane anchor subunit
MSYRNAKTGSTFQWFFQRVSSIVLVLFVGFHFVLTHYLMQGETTFQNTQQRLIHSPWKFFYLGFLLVALFHGLNGVREIALDFKVGKRHQTAVTWLCLLTGVLFFGIGIWAFTPFR